MCLEAAVGGAPGADRRDLPGLCSFLVQFSPSSLRGPDCIEP
jgi:hypothetical protein